ncbi:metal-dependent hydrolase [Pirellulales bacterium]|nr:metal-dependent hydrolase [Pirellulales bacterium]
MANFRTHVSTSTVLGIGYTGVGALYGLPVESALVAGGLCGVAGMLPDIDSDTGIPLRETMGFAAAIAPVMLIDRFIELGLNYEQIILAGGASYLFVRFALARLLARYTVHRGMFHSIPALLIFTGLAFLLSGSGNLQLRYFKAGGVFVGALSHLLLDELNSIEWKGGRWRFKKSFGTAMKLWGKSWWGNFSTYAKLAVVAVLILSEPMVMERYGQLSPIVVDHDVLRSRLRRGATPANSPLLATEQTPTPEIDANGAPLPFDQIQEPTPPDRDRTIYDTARRIWRQLRE